MNSGRRGRWIIGHRGVASLAPENTLGAVRRAAALGVPWVELDATLLGDGTAVVSHDASLDRCCDRSGPLAALGAADLAGINAAARFPDWPTEPLPRLGEMLRGLTELGLGLNLELKDHGLPPEQVATVVLEQLRAHFPDRHRLLVSSFQPELLAACRARDARLSLGLLYEMLAPDWREQARALEARAVLGHWQALLPEQVREIKAAGLKALVWTANDPAAIEPLWAAGLDGVISDRPQDFLQPACQG